MTTHDKARSDRAVAAEGSAYSSKEAELESLSDAIVGLQSTDDPSLNELHDRLLKRYLALKKELGR